MWIERNPSPAILRRIAKHPVVVLTGARQTGKTALARHLFPEWAYVSLDLPSAADLAERDPDAFLKAHPEPLIVDEIQYAPELLRHLKIVVDKDRNRAARFLLTGSQPFVLMHAVGESLAGRASIIHLEGLTWSEIWRAHPDMPIEEIVWRGGFPELYRDVEMDVLAYHQSYLATYLERDLRSQLNVTSLRNFERFLRAAALRTSGVLNQAGLARDIGISPNTAGAWLSALQTSSQIHLLEPWFGNATKRLMKSPKLHLCDSGTACFLAGIRSPEELATAPMAGAIWESAVIGECRRQCHAHGQPADLHYWRDRTKEADLLLHHGGRYTLADATWASQPTAKDARQLKRIARELDGEVTGCNVLCRAPMSHPLDDDIQAVAPQDVGAFILEQ